MSSYTARRNQWKRRLVDPDAEIGRKTREQVRDAARDRCRYSHLTNERDACRLAEAGYGWQYVRGPEFAKRIDDKLARQLVLGTD